MAAKDALQLHREFLHTRLEVRRPTVTHHHHRPPRSQVDLAHAQRRVDDAQQLVDELAALRTDLGPVMQVPPTSLCMHTLAFHLPLLKGSTVQDACGTGCGCGGTGACSGHELCIRRHWFGLFRAGLSKCTHCTCTHGLWVQCTLQEAQEVVAARQAAAKEQLQAAADALVKLRTHVAVARVGVQQLEAAKMLGTWTADTGNR